MQWFNLHLRMQWKEYYCLNIVSALDIMYVTAQCRDRKIEVILHQYSLIICCSLWWRGCHASPRRTSYRQSTAWSARRPWDSVTRSKHRLTACLMVSLTYKTVTYNMSDGKSYLQNIGVHYTWWYVLPLKYRSTICPMVSLTYKT